MSGETDATPTTDAPSLKDRSARVITFGAWVAAILILVIATFSSPSPSPELQDAKIVPGDHVTGPLGTPEDDGDIEVLEDGYSTIDNDEGEQFTWGAILTNTSQINVAEVQLEIQFLDDNGDSAGSAGPVRPMDLAGVLPGEQTGIGDVEYVDTTDIAEIDITVTRIQWWAVDNPHHEFAEVAISEITPRSAASDDDVAFIDFQVDSRYRQALEPTSVVILRDAAGDIIAGDQDGDHGFVPPGSSTRSHTLRGDLPDNFDEDATQIYLHRSRL